MNTIYVRLEMKWPPMFTTVDSGPISYRVFVTNMSDNEYMSDQDSDAGSEVSHKSGSSGKSRSRSASRSRSGKSSVDTRFYTKAYFHMQKYILTVFQQKFIFWANFIEFFFRR